MAKLVNLIPELSRIFDKRDYPEKTVAVFARHLRLAGLLSSSGRGLGGAEMVPSDCTNMIFAMASGLPAQDAAEAVAMYRALKPNGELYRDDDVPHLAIAEELKGLSFGEALDLLIAKAMADEFIAPIRTFAHQVGFGAYYAFVKIQSPHLGAKVMMGAGGPYFGGPLRAQNKVLGVMNYLAAEVTVPFVEDQSEEEVARELIEFSESIRGWGSMRSREETLPWQAIQSLGDLLKQKKKA